MFTWLNTCQPALSGWIQSPAECKNLGDFYTDSQKISQNRLAARIFFASCATSVYLLQVMGSMYAGYFLTLRRQLLNRKSLKGNTMNNVLKFSALALAAVLATGCS